MRSFARQRVETPFRAAPVSEAHVDTPHSGVRLSGTAPKVATFAREEATLLYRFECEPESGAVPREPATEPHLSAADPFESVVISCGTPAGPLSETRLDIARPVLSTPRIGGEERTLCSAGVVHAELEEATHLHFRFDDAPVTSVAGVPRPLPSLVSRWALRLSELALGAALGVGRVFTRS